MAFQRNITEITRSALNTKLGANAADINTWYVISDAVGSTKVIQVQAASVSALRGTAENFTDSAFGVYDIGADTFVAQANPIVVSSSLTAANDADYVVVASATFTDPTPAEGKGYSVFVRNGTATVGGVGYSVAGTTIVRVYHSGSWASYVYSQSESGTWAPTVTPDMVIFSNVSVLNAMYSRTGNLCSFSLVCEVDTLTYGGTTPGQFSFTLPITSTLSGPFDIIATSSMENVSYPINISQSVVVLQAADTAAFRVEIDPSYVGVSGVRISIVGQYLLG